MFVSVLIGIGSIVAFLAVVVVAGLWYISPSRIKFRTDASLAEKVDALDKWLAKQYRNRVFNGSVLIVKDGNVLFDRSLGYADLEKKVLLTNESSFNLASLSKPFTALSVLILVERKLVDLDAPISLYLPLLNFDSMTVKHLLHHTSGLPDYMSLAKKYMPEKEILKNEDVLSLMRQHRQKVLFAPGEKYEYSNTGYVVLACLVESVSKQSLEQFMDENIFLPLELKHSSVFNLLSSPDKLSHRVWGLATDSLNDLTSLDGVTGDGAVYSSLSDLLKWTRALDDGEIISRDLLNQTYSPGKINSGELIDYGYGWGVLGNGNVLHNGSWVGFNSLLAKNPAKDSILIYLDNRSNDYASPFMQKALSVFCSKLD